MSAEVPKIGKVVKTTGAAIAGVVSCVPQKQIANDYFLSAFGDAGVNDVIKMIGVETRHWADEHTTTRDLCAAAGRELLSQLEWQPDSVDALIFVSQTPDFRLPATACALQAELGLTTATIAFDINLGCSAYPYALWLASTMIQSGAVRRVLLAVGDTVSKIVNPNDRATALLFGDAGSMTAIESKDGEDAVFVMGTDGLGAKNLIIPEGGFKTDVLKGDERLLGKDPSCLFMDGGEIFNFTLRAVPTLVSTTVEQSGVSLLDHDAFLFHQANLFMLKHLMKKSKLPIDKVPININQFGNTSCASIPLLMTTMLCDRLKTQSTRLAMFGFGVGYSWSSSSLRVGPLRVAETIYL